MTCTVEYATDCKPQVSEKCNEIEYMECNEVPTEVCEKAEVQEPKQEFEHKKKCLLPDDGSLPRKQENEIEDEAQEASESRRESQSEAAPQEGYGAVKPDSLYGVPREGRQSKSLQQQALAFRQQQQQQLQLQQQRQARTFRGSVGQPRFQNRQGAFSSPQTHSRRNQNVKFNQGK